MNAEDEIKKAFLDGIEASGKKILAEAKDLAESEKAALGRALVVAGKMRLKLVANEECAGSDLADYAHAQATIKRYESIAALVLKDFSVNFAKDVAEVAGKVGKSFLSGFISSLGIPLPI